ncbi:hypothetical protein ACIA49_33090 [Kribbella sp. NPDC051587]|uniref:hypothetical protein n=1 Tax=Kribbella sp. NPDC051587 TaxID=3364119 RepID=UPI0037A661F2
MGFETQRLAKIWPGAILELSEGLGHRRILRDADTALLPNYFLFLGPIEINQGMK